jgi:hypothetical protein
MDEKKSPTVVLDELASGRLPNRIIAAINEMELTIEEVIEWETSKPEVRLTVTNKDLFVEMRVRIPIKKALAIFGGMGGLWATIQSVL